MAQLVICLICQMNGSIPSMFVSTYRTFFPCSVILVMFKVPHFSEG